ncbi:MAG: methyltransferase domain-containing protein [Saprospiraceae bacterium]
MRFVQHKKEAYYFYRFLSIFYDKFVNPLFWTARMRDESLALAELDRNLKVIDVGSGTGFTTQGIVKLVPPKNITCIDQSPHQMAKAKQKPDLQGCTFELGDAEEIPVPTDWFDRYVSAGSIEYWPNPQKGITEAYRVIKPDGIAVLIGPLEPKNPFARFIANTWMLFPTEDEYRMWFERAGFEDIKIHYIRPQWFRSKSEYGLAISGRKPEPGESPLPAASVEALAEPEKPMTPLRWAQLMLRVIVGSAAGFLFIPIALVGYLQRSFDQNKEDVPEEYKERLNEYQIGALIVIILLIILIFRAIF